MDILDKPQKNKNLWENKIIMDKMCENCWNDACKRQSEEFRKSKLNHCNGWTPCNERLPECPTDKEEEKPYFVTVERRRDGYIFTDKVVFHDYGWDVPSTCEVLAWQPLPEPYQKQLIKPQKGKQ